MRGTIWKILVCLLAVNFMAILEVDAGQRTRWRKTVGERPDEDKAYSLDDIMKKPKEFQERDVVFYCRFATTSTLFKNINTRFNSNNHVNFTVWPDKAALWDTKERKNLLPTLYIAKNDPEPLAVLKDTKRYELLAITGNVLNVYGGYPWILVTKVERIEKPSEHLNEQVIEHMQSGYEALRAGAGGPSARHFEQALQFGLPCEYRAKAYEQLAQAYLLDDKLDRARSYLRQAVETNKGDPVLHLALADVALRMGDAGEAIAHATFALESSGRYPQAYGIKGEAHSLLGDYGKAFADLNTAAGTPGITPREKAMVSIRRARIYMRSDRYPDAARVYVAASEPGEPLAGEAWLHNEIGLFYERLYLESCNPAYLDSAYSAFEEGTKLNRLDPAILYNMAEVEFRRQRLAEKPDFAKVAELVERINQVEPDYAPARILEGRLLYMEGKMEEAEFRYQSVSDQIGSNPTALLALAEAYLDLGCKDEADNCVLQAMSIQPWNDRVKILGAFIQESTPAVAYGYQQPAYAPPPQTYTPPRSAEEAAPAAEVDPESQAYYFDYDEYLRDNPDAQVEIRGASTRPGGASTRKLVLRQANGKQEIVVKQPITKVKAVPEEGEIVHEVRKPAPVKANTVASATKKAPIKNPEMAATRESLRPGSKGLGVGSSSLAAASRQPQDIQASVKPAVKGKGPKRQRFPVTEVRLPENRPQGRITRTVTSEETASRPRRNGGKMAMRAPGTQLRRSTVEPLDLGFNPGEKDKLTTVAKPTFDDFDEPEVVEEYNEEFGKDYEWEDAEGVEVLYEYEYEEDEEEEPYYSSIQGVHGAYASIPVDGREKGKAKPEADAVRIPKAFSFEPDDSPVILAGVNSPGSDLNGPARNSNVYRRYKGGRQPAEIIERPTFEPRPGSDTPAMVPPAGGVRRAEVTLPSSSLGVGMTSDYAPAK